MRRTASQTLYFTAFAAGLIAPAAAEARTLLVCHADWTRCVPLEAVAPAYVEGRSIRTAVQSGPTSLTGGADPDRGFRDYFFTEGGYYVRDGAGLAFQSATFAPDGRLCAADAASATCAYLVRLTADQFGAAANNALCFVTEARDQNLVMLSTCATEEWGGDHFNLRMRAMVSNMFGREEDAAPATPSSQQVSCAYVAQAGGGYTLDCAGENAQNPARMVAAQAPTTVASGADGETCAYEPLATGGYVLNCTAAPTAAAQEERKPFGLLALLPGFGGDAGSPAAPAERAQTGARQCAFENRDGGYHLVCQ